MKIEVWQDEHGVTWELVQMGLDGIAGGCIVREGFNSLSRSDGDYREGRGRHRPLRRGGRRRTFLEEEGFEPVH